MVTDPALLGRLDDAKLALVAGHASADATTLALFANEVVRRSQGQFMSTPTAASLAVATRADAPVEALRALALAHARAESLLDADALHDDAAIASLLFADDVREDSRPSPSRSSDRALAG